MLKSKPAKLLTLAGLLATLTACVPGNQVNQAQAPAKATSVAAPSALNNDDLYEVHTEHRIYVFDDYALYQDFLQLGHTPYVISRIGEGPHGETLVFGLRAEDKKKREGIGGVDLYYGKLQPADDFYGEIRMEGRIYVFDRLQDMESVRQTGEAPYRFTQIGEGPKGETVVYVLNGSNKKQRPDALIARFKAMNAQ